MAKAAKSTKVKTTREGTVWIGKTTSGVIKRYRGGLLYKFRFSDSHGIVVNRSKQVHISMKKSQARKDWQQWCEDIRAARYDADDYLKAQTSPTFRKLAAEDGPWFKVASTDYYASQESFLKVASKVKDLATNPNYHWFAGKKINELGLGDCQLLMDDLKSKYNKTFNARARYKQAISSVFRYAIEHGLVIVHPNAQVRIETKTERENRKMDKHIIALSKDERIAVLKAVNEDTYLTRRVLLKLAFGTGMRKGELMGLTWDEVMLDEKTPYLKVKHDLIEYTHTNPKDQRGEIKRGTKNGKARVVPLMPELVDDLKLLNKQSSHKVWKMNNGEKYDFVFSHENGQCFNLTSPLRWWEKLNNQLIKSGQVQQRVTFHKIRATALTMFANDLGLSIEDVRTIAGHSDVAVTTQYYVKEDLERMKRLGSELSF